MENTFFKYFVFCNQNRFCFFFFKYVYMYFVLKILFQKCFAKLWEIEILYLRHQASRLPLASNAPTLGFSRIVRLMEFKLVEVPPNAQRVSTIVACSSRSGANVMLTGDLFWRILFNFL